MGVFISIKDDKIEPLSYNDREQQFGGYVLCDTKEDVRTIYVGTSSGLVKLYLRDDGRWNKTPLLAKEINDEIRTLVSDRDNNLWIGTFTNGVYVLKSTGKGKTQLRHIDAHCGLPDTIGIGIPSCVLTMPYMPSMCRE